MSTRSLAIASAGVTTAVAISSPFKIIRMVSAGKERDEGRANDLGSHFYFLGVDR
jgi:hypothetical protein